MPHIDFTAKLAHDTIKAWTKGGSILEYLHDDLYARWFYRYITFRTVQLYTVTATTTGPGNKITTKTVLIPWPSGFGVLSPYLMNNDEAFGFMSAFLRGERAGIIEKCKESGIEFLVDRQLIPVV